MGAHLVLVLLERMAGYIKPYGLSFALKTFQCREIRDVRQVGAAPVLVGKRVEQRPLVAVRSPLLGGLDQVRQALQQLSTILLKAVEGPRAHQVLDHALVDEAKVDPGKEVPHGGVGAVGAPLRDYGFDGGVTCLGDGAYAEADHLAHRREARHRRVDVGREDLYSRVADLLHVGGHLLLLRADLAGEVGGHELGVVVRLEPGSLVGDEGVGGAVRLVETVPRELGHDVEDLDGRLLVYPPADAPRGELCALLLHDVRLLLSHGATEQVSLAEGVTGEQGRALHHLLLVEDDPVGLSQHVLEQRVQVLDARPSVLALDILVDHAASERTGAVHRKGGHEVLEAVHL